MASEKYRFVVTSELDVLSARKAGRTLAGDLGFDQVPVTEIEITISELGMNLVKHSLRGGEIFFGPTDAQGRAGFEVSTRDRGPGISDRLNALKDGVSSTGTLGIGLSGVKRMMDEFEIDSIPGGGTLVVARKWLSYRQAPQLKCSVLSRPRLGNLLNGDSYFIQNLDGGLFMAVIDGLGHGEGANQAALRAYQVLASEFKEPLEKIVEICHAELRHTRGAAMGMTRIDTVRKSFEHLAIGNIELKVFSGQRQVSPFFHNGTLGMQMESFRSHVYEYRSGMVFVMHSDGISRFALDEGFWSRSPVEIATHLFTHHGREYDDATLVVAV